ncbi:MAG: transcriptional initiation protein Tat [Nitrospiraceae bacterium]|nr:transcriptional initiation protein Tat [Nitrospiraceae bacterium]
MSDQNGLTSRREALMKMMLGIGAGMAAVGAGHVAWAGGMSGAPADLLAAGAATLKELSKRLEKVPRRRDFKTAPMVLTDPSQWDEKALNEVLHYAGAPKQVWDNTDLEGPWLNLMRNAMNVQIWSFKHPNFLAVSATHGTAHLALYDDYIWSKYLSKFTKGKWNSNVWLKEPPAAEANPAEFENPEGVFSPHDNSITVLQRRGVVFLACHNEIWELTLSLHQKGVNPDGLTHAQMAAEFTNHLIPGAVLTPGIVGTLPELMLAGYQYAK